MEVKNRSLLGEIRFCTEHVAALGPSVLHVLPLDYVEVLELALDFPDPDFVLLVVSVLILYPTSPHKYRNLAANICILSSITL